MCMYIGYWYLAIYLAIYLEPHTGHWRSLDARRRCCRSWREYINIITEIYSSCNVYLQLVYLSIYLSIYLEPHTDHWRFLGVRWRCCRSWGEYINIITEMYSSCKCVFVVGVSIYLSIYRFRATHWSLAIPRRSAAML